MRDRHAMAALLAAALLLSGGAARADDKMQIGVFGGAHLFNDDNELGQDDYEDAGSLQNSVAFGVRVTRRIIDLVSGEAELALIPSNVRDEPVDVTNFGWRVHALFHPLVLANGMLEPFALVGGGGSTASSADPDVFQNDTDFVAHLGVGARSKLGADWGVRLDLRMMLPPSSASEFVTTDWEFLAGLYKTFGKKAAAAAPAPAEAAAAPVTPAGDADGDKILDDVDACPADPEDLDGHADQDGCPDPDNDGDGVPDADDKCPVDKETANGYQDGDGCPDELPTSVQNFTGVIQGITFRTDSAQLAGASYAVLDAAVKVLKDYPEVRIEISGHTDSTGTAEYNRGLSQRRAESVKAYLVKKGVSETRLSAVGHGPDKPMGDNATPEGRAANRRVEFKLQ